MKLWIALLSLALALHLGAEEKEKPALGATTVKNAAGTLVQTVLPGRPIAAAPLPGGGLAVLLVPEDAPDGPRRIYRLNGEKADILLEVPKEVDALASWPNTGSPSEELWVGEPGRISRLTQDGSERALESLIEAKGLSLDALAAAGLDADGKLAVPGVRKLLFFARQAPGTWRQDGELPLPIKARRSAGGLEISTPQSFRLRFDSGRELFLLGPEAVGPLRLRSYALDPAAAEESRQKELWSRLPADEEVTSAFYTAIGEKPYLIALTTGKGVFDKLTLNVLQLREDRTRSGAGPSFRVEIEARRWFDPEIALRDLDGDGQLDLVLIEQQGLSGNDLWISSYRGKGQGRFDEEARRSKLDLADARWVWGEDLDHDSVPDLLVESGDQLLLYAGRPGGKGKLLEGKSKVTFEAPKLATAVVEVSLGTSNARAGNLGQEGAPMLFQLDDDAQPEVVLIRRSAGRAVVRVLDLQ